MIVDALDPGVAQPSAVLIFDMLNIPVPTYTNEMFTNEKEMQLLPYFEIFAKMHFT